MSECGWALIALGTIGVVVAYAAIYHRLRDRKFNQEFGAVERDPTPLPPQGDRKLFSE